MGIPRARLSRRRLVQGSLAALAAVRIPRLARPSDALRLAVVGLNGRGARLIEALRASRDVHVAVLCDVDEVVLARERRKLERTQRVDVTADFRRLLEREDVDAVALATPDHWHALQAIWACQAGKDVYVEMPVAHTPLEGQRLVAAAEKYGRIVRSGSASRSSPALRAALEWLRAGHLGRTQLVRALAYTPQPSIGKTERNQRIPDTLDYDLWCGPAPLVPLRRARLHHDWRYSYATGSGALGDPGAEVLDLARWALGAEAPPAAVQSLGARLGQDDDGETPNSGLVLFEGEPAPLLLELRGLPRDTAAQAGDWAAGMDDFQGVLSGVIVHAEGGTLRIPSPAGASAQDPAGQTIQSWPDARLEGEPRAGEPHLADWIAALRNGRREELGARIEEARLSGLLVQLANLSHRLGSSGDLPAIGEALARSEPLGEAFGRLNAHLLANGVDLTLRPLVLGARLELDASGSCTSPEGAPRLFTREYREPFVLPEI